MSDKSILSFPSITKIIVLFLYFTVVTSIGNWAFYKSSFSNPNLTSIKNTTGRSFNWKYIITGSPGVSSVTGTYNVVNVTTE